MEKWTRYPSSDGDTYHNKETNEVIQNDGIDKRWAQLNTKIILKEVEIVELDDDPEEIEGRLNAKKKEERLWRDEQLLLSDIELLKEIEKQFPELAKKRQALRDYPNQKDFPNNKRPKEKKND